MDPVTSIVVNFKRSTHDFCKALLHKVSTFTPPTNPIEILKRLQREAFSDLMKLRDRQDKVERVLSFYKTSKGGPFHETSTYIRGEIDAIGALLLLENISQHTPDALTRAGIRTGVHSKFIFETLLREKDALLAEFTARQPEGADGKVFGSPLALTKIMYVANINDQFSISVVPVGDQFSDVGIGAAMLQAQGLTEFSSFGPPLFNPCHSCAAGLTKKGSNYAASLGEFVSWPGTGLDNANSCLSTLGRVSYHPSKGTKLTLTGLRQTVREPAQRVRLGPLTVPISSLKFLKVSPEMSSLSPLTSNPTANTSEASISLMVESEIDDSSRIGAWVEWQRSHPRDIQWSFSMFDTPEDEVGWGFSVGGRTQGPSRWSHVQIEAFLKLNLGRRFQLQPGFVYALHEGTQVPALMFRSSWSL